MDRPNLILETAEDFWLVARGSTVVCGIVTLALGVAPTFPTRTLVGGMVPGDASRRVAGIGVAPMRTVGGIGVQLPWLVVGVGTELAAVMGVRTGLA